MSAHIELDLDSQAKAYARGELTSYLLNDGYKPTGFHTYTDATGLPIYWKVRLRHDTKGKTLRAFAINDGRVNTKTNQPYVGQFMPCEPSNAWQATYPQGKGKKPLYNLQHISSNPDDVVFIVEGEQDVDTLAGLGITATTSGGATSAGGANWQPLERRKVRLWRDYDEAGAKYQDEVLAALSSLGCDVSIVDVDALGLPATGDASDWLAMRTETKAADVLNLSLVADANKTTEEALTALFGNSGENSHIQIPDAILQTVIGKLAKRAAHTIELPLGSTFLVLLAGASASVMTNYCTQFRSTTRVALGIYTTVEQPPSTQKSRALSVAMNQYQKSIGTHNSAIYKANEGVPKPDQYPFAFKLATDPTTASLDKKLSDKDSGRFVIATAEQAAFQTLFPEASSFSTNNGLLLNGWMGEYVASERAGRESFTGKAQGAIVLFAQCGSIQRVLNASQGQGLTERFLFASEPTMLGMRTFANGYLSDQDQQEFNTAAESCVSRFSERLNKSDTDLFNATSVDRLVVIKPSNHGYELILSKRKQLEALLGQLNAQGELTYLGWLGKLETHVLKVSSVLHVFNCQANDIEVDELIPDQLIIDSMELVLNIGNHMRTLIQDGGEAGKTAEAETIIEVVTSGRMHTTTTAITKARNRKPFKALGKDAYMAAKKSINELLDIGILKTDDNGILRVT